jgi:hypothetical protein
MRDQTLAIAKTHTVDQHLSNHTGRSTIRWTCAIWVGFCLLASPPGWGADANEWSPGEGETVWGEVGLAAVFSGSRMAPNGVEYDPLFVLDTNFSVGLNSTHTFYLFSEDKFWGQEATAGVTNARQGSVDFSKREYDLMFGLGWRYWPHTEVRAFGYSFNNLNRGDSTTSPSGYKDGFGVENRFHFGDADDFVGVGYFVTKDMVDQQGETFKPGLFVKANLHAPIIPGLAIVSIEPQLICRDTFVPKLLEVDAAIGFTPFERKDIFLSLGMDTVYDLGKQLPRTILYSRVSISF